MKWELDSEEGWAPRHWCFSSVVLDKILESALDCKEIKPVNPKEISPEYSLEGLLLKLKLQYLATWCEEPTHWKRYWCWERLKAGGEGDDRGWDDLMASPAHWTWVWANSRRWWRIGSLACCSPWGHKELDMSEWLNKITLIISMVST